MSKEETSVIYLDHAATSWPKPAAVVEAVQRVMLHESANPGRGSHRMAVQASRVLFDTRKQLAKLFNIKNPNDIAFALNTTAALNLAIKGVLNPGDHVVATAVEHNSVRRPLEYLKKKMGIQVTYIETSEEGLLHQKQIEEALTARTKLVVINHSSNLLGSIVAIEQVSALTKTRGIKLLVDAAQSAGVLEIDVVAMGIDMLAFPGHKGLLGPQGTGGLYIHPELEIEPHMHGGTGSQSEAPEQPTIRPDRYEAGTQNTPGLAGLGEGVKYVLNETPQIIYNKEWEQTQVMMEGLASIGRVIRILGPNLGEPRTGIVSFTAEGVDPSELAHILDQHYGIAVRAGFHCSPLAHACAGTTATGAIRASVGYDTTMDHIQAIVAAMKEIMLHYR